MKIGILHHSFREFGGAERVVVEQARWLRERGHEVTCFAASFDPETVAGAEVRPFLFNLRLPKFRFAIPNAMNVLLSRLACQKLKDLDVLLCHHEPAPIIAHKAGVEYGVPYLCYLHHPPRFLYPTPLQRQLGWGHDYDRMAIQILSHTNPALKKLDYSAVINARQVLVNSHVMASQIADIYRVNPTVCYPGIRTNGFSQKPEIDVEDGFLLTTGRHTPHKLLDVLLRIFSIASRQFPWLKLVVTGKPHEVYSRWLQMLTKRLSLDKQVIFTGHLIDEQLAWLYQNAIAYLYTPVNEDFGMGPVEAMAYGSPAIAWKDGGPCETILDGVTGFLVAPYDIKLFADRTCMLVGNERVREAMSYEAKKHVAKTFDWNVHGLQLEDCFMRAVADCP
ncbi:MAG: glycosyltransferase family 4 protein [Candidatus Bathyarchaeota archaeon]|nr:glycosyltransferase family 4 protein [Candidatus Bathyarchaeota archaeon]